MNDKPFNISFCAIIIKLSKSTCPSLICQSQVSSFKHAFWKKDETYKKGATLTVTDHAHTRLTSTFPEAHPYFSLPTITTHKSTSQLTKIATLVSFSPFTYLSHKSIVPYTHNSLHNSYPCQTMTSLSFPSTDQ